MIINYRLPICNLFVLIKVNDMWFKSSVL